MTASAEVQDRFEGTLELTRQLVLEGKQVGDWACSLAAYISTGEPITRAAHNQMAAAAAAFPDRMSDYTRSAIGALVRGHRSTRGTGEGMELVCSVFMVLAMGAGLLAILEPWLFRQQPINRPKALELLTALEANVAAIRKVLT